jgi:hypothetical protein
MNAHALAEKLVDQKIRWCAPTPSWNPSEPPTPGHKWFTLSAYHPDDWDGTNTYRSFATAHDRKVAIAWAEDLLLRGFAVYLGTMTNYRLSDFTEAARAEQVWREAATRLARARADFELAEAQEQRARERFEALNAPPPDEPAPAVAAMAA